MGRKKTRAEEFAELEARLSPHPFRIDLTKIPPRFRPGLGVAIVYGLTLAAQNLKPPSDWVYLIESITFIAFTMILSWSKPLRDGRRPKKE